MRKHACFNPDALLPVHDPQHCYREICKQMILLEDHLNDPWKRCADCIRKHFLTIEALIEEAVSLDRDRKWDAQGKMLGVIRFLGGKWNEDVDPRHIAQVIRSFRKSLVPLCFDISQPGTRTGSGRKPSLASHVVDVYMAKRAQESEDVMVFLKDILGSVAFWGVKQTPYYCPEDLDKVLNRLAEILQPRVQNLMGLPVLWMKTVKELRDLLDSSLKSIPEFEYWNVAKAERHLPEEERSTLGFVSMYWHPSPDHDFIDLDALIQNVSSMVWRLSTAPVDDYPLDPVIPVKG